MHAELTLGLGIEVGHNAVEMLMRRACLKGLPGNRRRKPRHETPTAGDLVERAFSRDRRDQLWVTDITEHPTREGKVYCAVVLDVFSRRVVGWSIDATQTAALVTNALDMAIRNRSPDPTSKLIIHSDHGVQFTSWAFTERARASGLVPSMGSIGDCYDNAVIESFWGRMQTELLKRQRWRTRLELANAIFEYLEIFHTAADGTLPSACSHRSTTNGEPPSATRPTPYPDQDPSNPTPRNPGHIRVSGNAGAVHLLLTAIAESLETILSRAVSDRWSLMFKENLSPRDALNLWTPVVSACLPFSNQLADAADSNLKSSEKVGGAISKFQSMVEAAVDPNAAAYEKFSGQVLNK